MTKKRILWLFNHTSLRKFELPLLIGMGYEVYCPKSFNVEYGDFSASVTYEYDKTLNIPEEVVRYLNDQDFYNGISYDLMKVINKYFDIVFCTYYYETFRDLVIGFKGIFVLHTFGTNNSVSSTDIINYFGDWGILSLLEKRGNRFWNAPAYEHLVDLESSLLKGRTLYLPIGLSNTNIHDTWIGGDDRLLFISPKIQTNSYYNQIYKDFKKNFSDIPHVIGGAQLQKVSNDSTVTGFLPWEEYEYIMNHLCAMFYHSQEPYHLHYHPLEAVKFGMPLVFMAGGMLDYLGGKDLPGRCKTIDEAKAKINRIRRGDKELINAICKSQVKLLDKFTLEYCYPFWRQGMQKIEDSLANISPTETNKQKIAVILPNEYTGGVLDYTIRFALLLKQETDKRLDSIEIVFAHPDYEVFKKKDYFKKIRDAGIPIRKFTVEQLSYEVAERALQLAGYKSPNGIGFYLPEYLKLKDSIDDFSDIDYAIFTADSMVGSGVPFLLKPYTVVAHDYIQRYCPDCVLPNIDNMKMIIQRRADKVLVTSTPTLIDALQYGGLPENKVCLMPLLLDPMKPLSVEESERHNMRKVEKQEQLRLEKDFYGYLPIEKELDYVKKYFLWSTNAAPHKNHLRALEALLKYYLDGGSLYCVITGANTKYFKFTEDLTNAPVSVEYVKIIRDKINENSLLKDHIIVKGELPKEDYRMVLSDAKFVFHPGYADNGNGTALDAAGMGVPTLSSDYPAMRYMADFAHFPVKFMAPFEPDKMAKALTEMELECTQYAEKLPSYEELLKYSWREQGDRFYRVIQNILYL